MVKISIIIPAYNVENHIRKTISSVILQDFKDIEVIVINDGSTDNTQNVIEDLLKVDDRIKLINTSNNGVSSARNIGLSNSNGKYVMFVDGDDWIKENALTNLWGFAEKYNLDIVSFNYYKAFKDNNKLCKFNMKDEIISGNEALKEILINKMSPSVCDKMIRRDLFSEELKFKKSVKVGEDLLMSVKLCASIDKVGKLSEGYYYYYMRSDSVTHQVDEGIYTISESLDAIKDFLVEKDLYLCNSEEYDFLKFMHLYYYRIIVGDICDEFHKEFFNRYKKYRNFNNNKYYKQFINKCKLHEKIRVYLYKFSYPLGRLTQKVIKLLFR